MMYCFSKEMKNNATSILFILFSVLILNSCTKLDSTTLGSDLIPGSDRLATDTLNISVTTTSFANNDTSVVDKEALHAIGYINDPLFGTTTAQTYLQFLPEGYPLYPKPKDSLELDSVVLSLSYNLTYGDTLASSKFDVYEVKDTSFSRYKRYPVTAGFKINNGQLLGTKTFKATDMNKPYQIVRKKDTFSVTNQVRIRLNQTWGRLLLDQNIGQVFGQLPDSTFRAFLNGLVIVPDSSFSGSAIHYFGIQDTATKVNIYYRVRRTTPASPADYDTVTTVLRIYNLPNSDIKIEHLSASANKIFRNFSGSTAQPFLNSASPASLAFIQANPGTSVRIKIPNLNTLIGQRYIVHRAELVVRQIFQGPVSLENQLLQPAVHLFTLDNAGNNQPIPYDSTRYFFQSNTPFSFTRLVYPFNIDETYTGGLPNYFNDVNSNRVAEYRMNITRYVQNIINGKAQLRDFKLEAPYFANFKAPQGFDFNISSTSIFNLIAAGRVQVGGGSHPTYPMFVRIYYSKQ
jgi:Domain of unknown function (DUF4270)